MARSPCPGKIDASNARLADGGAIDFDDADTLVLTVTLVQSDGSTLTYRQETTTARTEDGVTVLWPPKRTVCPLVTDCGTEGTYLPDRPQNPDWLRFETTVPPP